MRGYLFGLVGMAALLSACNRADRAAEIAGPGNQAGMESIGDNKSAATPQSPSDQGSSSVAR